MFHTLFILLSVATYYLYPTTVTCQLDDLHEYMGMIRHNAVFSYCNYTETLTGNLLYEYIRSKPIIVTVTHPLSRMIGYGPYIFLCIQYLSFLSAVTILCLIHSYDKKEAQPLTTTDKVTTTYANDEMKGEFEDEMKGEFEDEMKGE